MWAVTVVTTQAERWTPTPGQLWAHTSCPPTPLTSSRLTSTKDITATSRGHTMHSFSDHYETQPFSEQNLPALNRCQACVWHCHHIQYSVQDGINTLCTNWISLLFYFLASGWSNVHITDLRAAHTFTFPQGSMSKMCNWNPLTRAPFFHLMCKDPATNDNGITRKITNAKPETFNITFAAFSKVSKGNHCCPRVNRIQTICVWRRFSVEHDCASFHYQRINGRQSLDNWVLAGNFGMEAC